MNERKCSCNDFSTLKGSRHWKYLWSSRTMHDIRIFAIVLNANLTITGLLEINCATWHFPIFNCSIKGCGIQLKLEINLTAQTWPLFPNAYYQTILEMCSTNVLSDNPFVRAPVFCIRRAYRIVCASLNCFVQDSARYFGAVVTDCMQKLVEVSQNNVTKCLHRVRIMPTTKNITYAWEIH